MFRFNKYLFENHTIPYIYERNIESNYDKKKLKELLISENNINLLTRMMLAELDLDSENSFKTNKIKVKEYMKSWVNLGKIDSNDILEKTMGMNIHTAIDFINNLFIDVFKKKFYSDDMEYYTMDTNPFKQTKQGKLHKNLTASDYELLNVQQDEKVFTINEYINIPSNKIPHYNNLSKGRHYERDNLSGLNASGYDKENFVYKRYGDKSFKELLKYEDFNTEFKHLPTQDNIDFY